MTAFSRNLLVSNGLLLLLLLVLLGCGSNGTGVVENSDLDIGRQGAGVTVDGYEVLRYNPEGFTDPALNGTIGVEVERIDGLTALTVRVSDPADMSSISVNVNYNSATTHPERAEFHGLLGGEGDVLNAAFLNRPGVAGLAEAPIGTFNPGSFSGEFVTLYFADGPSRNVSAIGDVHHNDAGVGSLFLAPGTIPVNLVAEWDTDAKTANVSWTAGWHCGDGDQNSETNAADLVPLALNFGQATASNWSAIIADYDLNGEVNASDIQRIGVFFGEKTNAYVIDAADDDGSGRTNVMQMPWVPAMDATGGAAGELKSAFKFWEVNFDSATDFSYDDLAALDVDGNGSVNVYVTPITLAGATTDQTGAEAVIGIEVESKPPALQMFIEDYVITIEGTDNGSAGTTYTGDGTALIESANSDVDFSLTSISGTFQGVAFDEGSLATGQGMTQQHYDDALASARAALDWNFSHGGAAGFRRSADWIDLDSGNPGDAPFSVTGDPGPGTVFPDDDPESTGASAEGVLTTTMPAGGDGTYFWDDELHVQVLANVDYTINVDIDSDEEAPEIVSYNVDELTSIITEPFIMELAWGSGGEPADLSTTDLQLCKIDTATGTVQSTIDFSWIERKPFNSAREFVVRDAERLEIEANVPGASLEANSSYAFRFFDGTTWSSINKPELLLTTKPPPPPQDLLSLPSTMDRSVNYLQIFYEDPVIRRNSFFIVDPFAGEAYPEDEEAYNDALKINGDEFPVAVVEVGNPPLNKVFPTIVVEGGTSSPYPPSNITGPDDPDAVFGVQIPLQNGNRIIVDVRVLTGPPLPTDDDEYYAYKLFNADGSAVGQGTFYVPVLGIPVSGPTGIGYGINVFNRETKEFSARTYTNRTLVSAQVGTTTPPVLWVEFQDGWVYTAFEDAADRPYENVHMYLQDTNVSGGSMDMVLGLRVVGLTPDNSYLSIHTVVDEDYFDLGNPGAGILRPGRTYTVSIDDNRTPGIDHEFPLPLVVTP